MGHRAVAGALTKGASKNIRFTLLAQIELTVYFGELYIRKQNVVVVDFIDRRELNFTPVLVYNTLRYE